MLWQRPPNPPFDLFTLASNSVHVWRANLVLSPNLLNQISACLSSDEWARAKRFRFDRDRDRFIASRATLRHILSRYIDCAAEAISFDYGAYGKPSLAIQTTRLEFNLSHSGDIALYAIGQQPLGIDIEYIKPRSHLENLARHCLSTSEYAAWDQQPEATKITTFLKFWTCKEAYLKALGRGLTQAMTEIEIEFCPHPVLCMQPHSQGFNPYTLRELTPGEGYVAAIAVAGTDWQLTGWEFDASSMRV
ncbi:MAG: 4'-phosphopantetheinyl transferase superfamily protein [Cyanobacteria bacterium J06639_16]